VASVRGVPGGLERGDELSALDLTCIVEIPKGSRNKYEYDLDQDRHSEVRGWDNRDAALETLTRARERFVEGTIAAPS
jgi:inorganic pyrophosphatase